MAKFYEFEGGVVGEVLRIRGGGVVGEVLPNSRGGSRREVLRIRGGVVGEVLRNPGAVVSAARGHSAEGIQRGGTQRGALIGGY